MKPLVLIAIAALLSACGANGSMPGHGASLGRFPQAVPSPNECVNAAPNIADEVDGSYDDGKGCDTTVLDHQIISNVAVPVCTGWC